MASTPQCERELWSSLRCESGERGRAEAAFELASLLCGRRDLETAEALLSSMTEHGDEAIAAEAWIRLAEILDEQGKARYCELAYDRAFELATVETTPGIMLDLAQRFDARGATNRALVIYQQLVNAAEDNGLRAVAAFRFAGLLRRIGCPSRAVDLLRTVLPRAGDSWAPHVEVALAEALIELWPEEPSGRVAWSEARRLLQIAIESDHPDLAPRAALRLARLRQREDRPNDAHRLCQLVIDSEHSDFIDEAHHIKPPVTRDCVERLCHQNWQLTAPSMDLVSDR